MAIQEFPSKKRTMRERSIFIPRVVRSPREIQERRKKLKLSRTETYDRLRHRTGRELLASEPVLNLMAYSSNWEPFIRNHQPKIQMDSPLQKESPLSGALALPHPFVIPSIKEGAGNQWGNMQFYWDIYFINKALLATGKPEYLELAKGHIENFQYLFDQLGYIPNGSGLSIINRTQTPYLTGMIMDIYRATGDKEWLAKKIELAKREYYDVWTYTEEEGHARGISRPSHRISSDSVLLRHTGNDSLPLHYDGAASSTMDDSAEWARRSYETVALNLNCAVYKYEKEFADAARILGNYTEADYWEAAAQKRKDEMNTKMWDEKKGMYCNLQLDRKTQEWKLDTAYKGITGFMPLWINIATKEQAEKVMRHLHEFESPYGLFIATRHSRMSEREAHARAYIATMFGRRAHRHRFAAEDTFKPEQWDYPNVWSPMEYFAIEGMLNYGFTNDARRSIENILRANAAFFQEKGTLPEKMNGVSGFNGGSYQYGDQEGFGWTCAMNLISGGRLQDILNGRFATIAA